MLFQHFSNKITSVMNGAATASLLNHSKRNAAHAGSSGILYSDSLKGRNVHQDSLYFLGMDRIETTRFKHVDYG